MRTTAGAGVSHTHFDCRPCGVHESHGDDAQHADLIAAKLAEKMQGAEKLPK